jgi:hypothetical protein
MNWIDTVAIALVIVAGLSAPLAICALSLAALNGWLLLRPEFAWIGLPWLFGAACIAFVIQVGADLYFVPITVKDGMYLNPRRMYNAYLHARVQSLLRPLAAALVVAALPLPLADWIAAVGGFTGAAGCYWLSAWIREYVAVTRGALLLFVLETLKNALLIPLAVLVFWLPPLGLGLLIAMLVPAVLWTARLQHEHTVYTRYGGQHVGKDA